MQIRLSQEDLAAGNIPDARIFFEVDDDSGFHEHAIGAKALAMHALTASQLDLDLASLEPYDLLAFRVGRSLSYAQPYNSEFSSDTDDQSDAKKAAPLECSFSSLAMLGSCLAYYYSNTEADLTTIPFSAENRGPMSAARRHEGRLARRMADIIEKYVPVSPLEPSKSTLVFGLTNDRTS
jgi:hypothetical protein